MVFAIKKQHQVCMTFRSHQGRKTTGISCHCILSFHGRESQAGSVSSTPLQAQTCLITLALPQGFLCYQYLWVSDWTSSSNSISLTSWDRWLHEGKKSQLPEPGASWTSFDPGNFISRGGFLVDHWRYSPGLFLVCFLTKPGKIAFYGPLYTEPFFSGTYTRNPMWQLEPFRLILMVFALFQMCILGIKLSILGLVASTLPT